MKFHFSFVFALFLSILQHGPAQAQIVTFVDRSQFQNFVVSAMLPEGDEVLLNQNEGSYSISLSDFSIGEIITFEVQFFVPNEVGAENFFVRKASTMTVILTVRVTEKLKQRDQILPVYYFDSIGRHGFDQIDPISYSIEDRVFEQFFKSAQMAEHYYLRMATYDTPEFRRAFRLWRDASYHLGSREFDWWKMSDDIEAASKRAFGDGSQAHSATLKYMTEVNKDRR